MSYTIEVEGVEGIEEGKGVITMTFPDDYVIQEEANTTPAPNQSMLDEEGNATPVSVASMNYEEPLTATMSASSTDSFSLESPVPEYEAKPSSPQTFTPFPDLPPEIRLQIWTHAALVPRNIDLWALPTPPSSYLSKVGTGPTFRYSTLAPIPALLHTCWEARFVGLRYYELGFRELRQEDDGRDAVDDGIKGIYINWTLDTIIPLDLWRWENAALGHLFSERRIKHLALNVEVGEWRCAWFLGLRLSTLILYLWERSFRLSEMLDHRSGTGFEVAFEERVDRGGARGVVWRLDELEMEGLREAKARIEYEFDELEALQQDWEGRIGDDGFREAVHGSPVFGDVFSRSAGWLKGEEEVREKRERPRIEFTSVRMGGRE